MAQLSLPQVDALRESFPEPAKDMKLNLGGLVQAIFSMTSNSGASPFAARISWGTSA